jgi:hypothetical protein
MKIVLEKYILLLLLLICGSAAYAQIPPPPPPPGQDPPVVSIDENIFVLFNFAILFGIYIIYRNNLKNKNPI